MVTVKVLDGGFSGQLSHYIDTKIDGNPLWTAQFLATHQDAIYNTHMDFLCAGADVIETNTYQASVQSLMKYLNISMNESVLLLQKAVQLAKTAIMNYSKQIVDVKEKPILIAGSCGPYGTYLHDGSEYTGNYGKTMRQQELMDWHRPRIQTLLNAGVDLLALETIPCVEEADALVELLREFPHARAWLSFSCPDGQHLADGSNFQKVAVSCYRALPSQIVAIGVNCVVPNYITPLLRGINIKDMSQDFIPLIVYPNRGGSYSANGDWISVPNNHSINLPISEWLELGVRYIGGCCNIFAEDIKIIRLEVDRYCEK